jgi:DNA-binding NarL/FixJ family response regulator
VGAALSGPVPVAVVDDHPLFRSAVVGAFEGEPDVTVVLECGSVEELEARLDTVPVRPTVVLLDLSLPGRSGADAVRAVAARGPAVLVLSGSAVRNQLVGVLSSGARGYLVKTARAEEIVHATRTVAAGHGYLAPEVASLLTVAMQDRAGQLWDITAREREVLLLVATGLTDRMIAERLTISLATVRSHLDRIRSKTGSRRRADLTRIAVQAGLTADTDGR